MGTNNGNVGVKGRSGRKSAFVEKQIADMVKEAFETGVDYQKLKKVLADMKSGKAKRVRLIDIALAKAVKGDRILDDMLKKLMPDRIVDDTPERESPAEQIIEVLLTEQKKSPSKRPPKKKKV